MPAACTAALPAGVAGSVRGGRGWRDCASSRGRTASSGHEPCSLSLKGVCLLEAGGRSVSSSPVRSHSLKDTDTNCPPGGSQALAKRTSPDVRAHVPPALRPALRGPLLCLRFSSSAEEQPPPAPPGRSRRKSPPARRSGLVTSLAQAAARRPCTAGTEGRAVPQLTRGHLTRDKCHPQSRCLVSISEADERGKPGQASSPRLLRPWIAAPRRVTSGRAGAATLPFSSISS